MTNRPEQHDIPPPPAPFPEANDVYATSQTPAEAGLHGTMRELLAITSPSMGTFEETIPISDFVQRENLPVASDATHVGIKGYQDTDFAMFSQGYPELGLRTTLTARERYPLGEGGPEEPVEPLRLGVDVNESPEQPGIHIDVTVPSRGFTEYEAEVTFARQPEEVSPPHARVIIGDGINVSQLMNQVRANVEKLGLPVGKAEVFMGEVDATAGFFSALGALTIEGQPADASGIREAVFQLSESQMQAVTKWLDQLYGGLPSIAR